MEDILPKDQASANAPESTSKKNKFKISVLGVFLTIILTIALILLGERILFDLNKAVNPLIESSTQTVQNYRTSYSNKYVSERSPLSQTVIRYEKEKKGEYVLYKMLIHSAFVIPIFLLMIFFYFRFNLRDKFSDLRVVMWGYVIFSFWMILHLLGEIGKYVFEQYKNAAVYIVLLLLVVIFSILAVLLQNRTNKHLS